MNVSRKEKCPLLTAKRLHQRIEQRKDRQPEQDFTNRKERVCDYQGTLVKPNLAIGLPRLGIGSK